MREPIQASAEIEAINNAVHERNSFFGSPNAYRGRRKFDASAIQTTVCARAVSPFVPVSQLYDWNDGATQPSASPIACTGVPRRNDAR
jgi:hypothetical protein